METLYIEIDCCQEYLVATLSTVYNPAIHFGQSCQSMLVENRTTDVDFRYTKSQFYTFLRFKHVLWVNERNMHKYVQHGRGNLAIVSFEA